MLEAVGFWVRGGVMVNSLTVFGPGLQVSLGRFPKEHSGLSVAHLSHPGLCTVDTTSSEIPKARNS